ncbi:acyltransferase [Antrihabitans sp. YC2-6]|uniref:acyltransferase family protein n=1 Tax=Antrihabitans sp. YC2-6 TaxID=2799498 RepID=UPI0018F4AD19|nr:acyltransferase [Antrihabitans sp. YC2-6]MBJ8345433.1 acyltransferase [Antrihabitans sp. YC2-6]
MAAISHADYLAIRRFPALDGLRAFAAVSVVIFHFGGKEWEFLSGWIGVQLFFVLSGFLITTLALREESRFGRISLRNFYVRRVFRIMPVYFVLLGLTVFVWVVRGKFFGTPLQAAFPDYLLFWNEFVANNPFGHSWSLGIEQKFYFVWPLLAFGLLAAGGRAGGRRIAATAGTMVLALALIPPTLGSQQTAWSYHYFSILCGCLLALGMHSRRGFAVVAPLTRPYVAIAVAIAFVGVHLAVRPGARLLGQHAPGDLPGFVLVCPLYAIAVALFLPAVITPGPVQRVLSARPLVFVGERSYSLYLVQALAGFAVVSVYPSVDGTWKALAVIVIGLTAADVLYRCIELPLIKFGQRYVVPHKLPTSTDAPDSGQPRGARYDEGDRSPGRTRIVTTI